MSDASDQEVLDAIRAHATGDGGAGAGAGASSPAPSSDSDALDAIRSHAAANPTLGGSSPSWGHTAKFLAQETLRGGAMLAGIPGDLGRLLSFPSSHPVDSYLPGIGDVNRGFDWAEGKLGVSPLVEGSSGEGYGGALARNVVPTALALGTGGALGPTLAAGVAGPLASEKVRQAGGGPLPQIAAGVAAGMGVGGIGATAKAIAKNAADKTALASATSAAEGAKADLSTLRVQAAQGKESNLNGILSAGDALTEQKSQLAQATAPIKAELDSLKIRQANSSARLAQAKNDLRGLDPEDPEFARASFRVHMFDGWHKDLLAEIQGRKATLGQMVSDIQKGTTPGISAAQQGLLAAQRQAQLDSARNTTALEQARALASQRQNELTKLTVPEHPWDTIKRVLVGESLLGGPIGLGLNHFLGIPPFLAEKTGAALGTGIGLTIHLGKHLGNPLLLQGAAQGAVPGLVAPGWKGGGGQ